MLRLTFVRHGEPAWVVGGLTDYADPPLSARGVAEARSLAGAGCWDGVTDLWVSPLRRASETADHLEPVLGVRRRVRPWLAEIALPASWSGSPVDQVQQMMAVANARPLADWWDGVEGGERTRDFHQRVTEGLESSLGELGYRPLHGGAREHAWAGPTEARHVVIVAHNGSNSVAISHLLGLDPVPWEFERFGAPTASVSVVSSLPIGSVEVFAMRAFGITAHLPAPAPRPTRPAHASG